MPTTGSYSFERAEKSADGLIKREDYIARGEWAWVDRTHDFGDGIRHFMVYCRCPDCGLLATVWRRESTPGHSRELSTDGILTPSVQCPHGSCGFHTQPTRLLDFVDLR
jgi:hypothetical protein